MKYDVIVIGGGPAGMMSAGRAAELGAKVLLLEKNKHLGIKLLCTGKGRCNITNNIEEIKKLVDKYGKNGKFLFSAFNKFKVEDTVNFFEKRGVKTKVERGERIFPVSDRALDVLNALIKYMRQSKVEIITEAQVKNILMEKKVIKKVILENGQELKAKNYIICTGGKSYPLTGSTGDGYKWLKKMGHTIIFPRPALTPIIIKEKFVKELEGLSLKNVEISILKNNKKIISRFGEALFTNNGLSGPIILDMSKKIGEELVNKLKLKIDFKPVLDFIKLDERVQRDFQKNSNKLFKNSLNELLPQKLIPIIIKLSGIDPNKKVNLITKTERKIIIHLLKEFELEIGGLVGFEKAIITAGGVELTEVDPKTMQSKIISNLYLAGEILDIDGPTGGYNLQVCWSTGFVAGENSIL
jgi:predicted Rossmann fold flavoprotein